MVHSSAAINLESSADPLIGQMLAGRFHILERLGTGGMGVVYKALQSPTDRIVALKVLNPQRVDGDFERRFLVEGAVASHLTHPNTAGILECGKTEEDLFFIAMEYVEGETLAAVLARDGRLPWTRALDIIRQVCESVREAHQTGMLHRDVKPANIMLTREQEEEVVKVLDFGLLESLTPVAQDRESESAAHSLFVGSPLYMSPEQAKNRPEERSDIYSVGVVLYEMLAGRPPFVAEHSLDVVLMHLKETPPPLATWLEGTECPEHVVTLVHKCLEKDPAQRFQTMDELGHAITALLNPESVSASFSPFETANSRSQWAPWMNRLRAYVERRLVVVGVLLGVGFAGLGCLLYLWWQHSQPAPIVDGRTSSIRFRVDSEPEGAQVALGRHALGLTPLQFDLELEEDGAATAELTFTLEGYEPRTVTASGTGPTLVLSQKLDRLASRK